MLAALILSASLAAPSPAGGDTLALPAFRLTAAIGAPVLDGRLDDAVWAAADTIVQRLSAWCLGKNTRWIDVETGNSMYIRGVREGGLGAVVAASSRIFTPLTDALDFRIRRERGVDRRGREGDVRKTTRRGMMHRQFVTLAAAGAVVALAGAAAAQERFTLEGDRAAIYNLAGGVRVEPGRGASVVVEITRGGSDAGRLSVRRGNAGILAIVYPDGDVVYPALGGGGSRSTLHVRSDGTFGGDQGLGFGGGHRVTIRGSGSGTRAWADVRVLVPAGRTVSVNQGVGRVDVTNVNGSVRVKGQSATIVASGTRGRLDLDTGSGGITVTNAEGDVRLDTGSGGVHVNGVRGSGLDVDTGSGGVEGSDLSVARLHVDVGSGGVRLEGVDARDIDIDTGSGSVVLRLRRDAEDVKIDTGSGGVTLGLPRDFGADAEIDTGSGGIHVDVPANVRRASRTHFSGTFGNGGGHLVIDTGSGGVRVVAN